MILRVNIELKLFIAEFNRANKKKGLLDEFKKALKIN
jgi:hypothetical protein